VLLIGLNTLSSKCRMSFFDILVTPVFPFYQGVVMKIVRLCAFVSEIILCCSSRDDYVPLRIRQALYQAPGKPR
jgi:hypothetical protein